MTTIQNETVADIIKELAEIPCPICQGTGYVAPVEQRQCGACRNSGGRFPWLRTPCYGLWLIIEGKEFFDETHTKCRCGGKHWLPHLDIALEDAIAALTSEHSLLVLHEWRNILPLAVGTTAEDVRRAFWRAVEKVVVNDVQ